MKKTLIGLFASSALVLGTSAIGSSATAAPTKVYPGTVVTTTAIASTAVKAENKRFTVRVVVTAGNATVSEGSATVIFGGKRYVGPVFNGLATFRVKAPKVNKTKFKTLKANFKVVGGSVFKPSSASKKILIRNIAKK